MNEILTLSLPRHLHLEGFLKQSKDLVDFRLQLNFIHHIVIPSKHSLAQGVKNNLDTSILFFNPRNLIFVHLHKLGSKGIKNHLDSSVLLFDPRNFFFMHLHKSGSHGLEHLGDLFLLDSFIFRHFVLNHFGEGLLKLLDYLHGIFVGLDDFSFARFYHIYEDVAQERNSPQGVLVVLYYFLLAGFHLFHEALTE